MKYLICVLVKLLIVTLVYLDTEATPCMPRYYNKSASFVCVCNSTYCDTLVAPQPNKDIVLLYTSTSSSKRFAASKLELNRSFKPTDDVLTISINTQEKYQTIKGFGAAITDAACINVMKLSSGAQDNLINSYFSSNGIEYNIGRIPIASCDYSAREYTYLETPNDFNLSTFALVDEDTKLRIPIIKKILAKSAKNVSFYGSPWTAPAWMKTNGEEAGWGWLKGVPGDKYHKTWAQYFVEYLNAYKKYGIQFWGLTMQNEPSNGLLVKADWQSTGWTPQTERDFIKMDLGPALHNGGYKDVKLMVLDDQRMFLPAWSNIILSDPEAAKYVSGIGVHWYWNWLVGPELLTKTHEDTPDYFILATEACNKAYLNESDNWASGEKYSQDILDNLNNWGIGWVDWNMCLDEKGGPNWAGNWDASPIIVNGTGDEFYKQPMFYHMGHFSKFIPEGSVRISSHASMESDIQFVSVLRSDNVIVLVVLNKSTKNQQFQVNVNNALSSFKSTIPQKAIQTYMWKL